MTQLNRFHARETGLTKPPARDTGRNQSHAREAGLNQSHAREAGLNQSPARDTGRNQSLAREAGLNQSPAREAERNQSPARDTGLNQSPARDTGLNHQLETMLNEAERRALVAVLRSRPHLTLDKLQDCFTGRYGAILRTITVRELLESDLDIQLPDDGGPLIDRSALEQAKRLNGPAFDACVLRAICSAGGEPVSASYLRARVGGPRWKLQGSLRRLVDAGEVERDGVTSSTRYRSIRSTGSIRSMRS